MNPQTLPPMNVLLRRFTLPILAAWLIHTGVWMIVLTLTQPVLSGLMSIANWCIEHFTAGNSLAEVSWNLSFTAGQVVENMIPIALGLLLGFWVRHNKSQNKQRIS